MKNITIHTEFGDIVAEVYDERAPRTVANFLRYVHGGHFVGGNFWRTVRMDNQPGVAHKIEVIQAGVHKLREADQFPPVALERTRDTGLKHEDGTLSMARREVDGAQSAFFICIGAQPNLDFGGPRYADGQGFAAFGRVTRGMDVVRLIHQSPCSTQGGQKTEYAQVEFQHLTPAIGIHNISSQ
jgi:peptidyl-prolyl cis-trans isomerase A (cyclophilin A)